VPSGGSNPARLGELGGNHLPLYSYKWGKEGRVNCSTLLVFEDSLEISEENCFREKNPSRSASVMLPRCFRERFREDSSLFLIVLCFGATYPSAGGRRVTRGMRLPRKEYTWSRHQRLFKENVRKTGKDHRSCTEKKEAN